MGEVGGYSRSVLVEDQPAVIAALVRLLETEPGFTVCGHAATLTRSRGHHFRCTGEALTGRAQVHLSSKNGVNRVYQAFSNIRLHQVA